MKTLYYFLVIFALNINYAYSHEMTPAYPKLTPAHVDGISSARLKLFNRRSDAIYYEIGVFDENWNPLPFAANERILNINYLETIEFEVYIRNSDRNKVTYLCTTSKLLKKDVLFTGVTSKICSKIKKD